MSNRGDFYEDDEPVEDVLAAFESGEPVVTVAPSRRGANETVEVPGLRYDVDTSGPRRMPPGEHDYLSTACLHGYHEGSGDDRCCRVCKYCDAACRCECHAEKEAPTP